MANDVKPNIALKVDGVRYEGWTDLRARRTIETVAGYFELTVTDRWAGQSVRPIRPGQSCQLMLGDRTIITGYVDDVNPRYGNGMHTVQVCGRCKTADLVDCSAVYKSGQWFNRTLPQIAADLCKDFGITVVVESDPGASFSSFNIQQGETAFECIERAARLRAVLLISDANGNLVITRAAPARFKSMAVDNASLSDLMSDKITTRLVQGANILAASGRFSMKDRYSEYTIKGQAPGTDEFNGKQSAQVKYTVMDQSVPRHRPLVIVSQDAGSGASLHDRAVWEKNVRFARGCRATLTVQGWTHDAGLWLPNKLIDVDSPFLDLNDEMLIAAVTYSLDGEGGTLTELEIVLPDAFDLVRGVGRSRLSRRLNDKTRREKKKKGDIPSFYQNDLGVD